MEVKLLQGTHITGPDNVTSGIIRPVAWQVHLAPMFRVNWAKMSLSHQLWEG